MASLKPPLHSRTLKDSDGVRQSLDHGPFQGYDLTIGRSIRPILKSNRFSSPRGNNNRDSPNMRNVM